MASLKLALFCMTGFLVLVFIGTLDQVNLGIFYAQKKYFQSFFLYWNPMAGVKIPIFPGGFLLGNLLIINLLSVIFVRRLFRREKWGLLVIHVGLVVLLLGGGLTSYLGVESQAQIEEGQKVFYSENTRSVELAIIRQLNSDDDKVVAIPESVLKEEGVVEVPELPFSVHVHKFLPNAVLSRGEQESERFPEVTEGIGVRLQVAPKPVFVQDNLINVSTVFVELYLEKRSLGMWLFSRGLDATQTVTVHGVDYVMQIRPERYYVPYSLTLKDFSHDRYVGTDIPKNFSSLVQLEDAERKESREILIYMNHPLRYRGKTYYQASFGKNDTLSVLQVVENPSWLLPYISCTLISVGLSIQFLTSFIRFSRKKRK
ncbi:MAG: hypothetical protein ACI9BD_001300 [Candidatus Marinamargulisbacteria bacterium]|jgi:hypothetical protein